MSSHPDGAEARQRILRQRAVVLAQAEETVAASDEAEFVVFQLAWESYAVETGFIREIFPLKELTPIPCTPAFVLGIINLRGELCPVIDLKRLFGLPEQNLTNATSAVILHDRNMEFGIVADVITGVRAISPQELQPPPQTLSGVNAAFLLGVTGDRVIVLDAARVLAHPDLVVDQQVETV